MWVLPESTMENSTCNPQSNNYGLAPTTSASILQANSMTGSEKAALFGGNLFKNRTLFQPVLTGCDA
jgi:hypothetical protein